MGVHTSKEELLYQGVAKGNHDAVKGYQRDGASLEWVDKEGRTPLMLACTQPELFNMATTLLNLGANINAYRTGSHGGFPLHLAARKGLEKTVILLLSRGADPFALNDDDYTPLELARSRNHVSVVRLLEDRVALFTGMLREISGPGIFKALVPQLCTKKIWAVVIPVDSPGRKAPKYELAIYTSPKVAQPRTIVKLFEAQLREPKLTSTEPVFHIIDKATNTKYEVLSEKEGDSAQLEKFYKACKGVPQIRCRVILPDPPASAFLPESTRGNSHQIHPISPKQNGGRSFLRNHELRQGVGAPNASGLYKHATSEAAVMPGDVELALAFDASIHSAAEQGIPVPLVLSRAGFADPVRRGGLALLGSDREPAGACGSAWRPSWSSAHTLQTGRQSSPVSDPQRASTHGYGSNPTSVAIPSAPPLPQVSSIEDGFTGYSFVPTLLGVGSSANSDKGETERVGGTCVICWDAPAEGACIPCGHIAGCMSCLSEISQAKIGCPICRASIQQTIRVYAV